MSQKRGDGGEFVPKVTDSDVLRALREHPDPVATTRELASTLRVSPETVRRHLTELTERGLVRRKSVGAHAVVWWLDADAAPPDDPAEDPLFGLPTFSGTDPTNASETVDELVAAGISNDDDRDGS